MSNQPYKIYEYYDPLGKAKFREYGLYITDEKYNALFWKPLGKGQKFIRIKVPFSMISYRVKHKNLSFRKNLTTKQFCEVVKMNKCPNPNCHGIFCLFALSSDSPLPCCGSETDCQNWRQKLEKDKETANQSQGATETPKETPKEKEELPVLACYVEK